MNLTPLRNELLGAAALAHLDALAIMKRAESPWSMTVDAARKVAQGIADRDRVQMVVGWSLDDEGRRRVEYGPAGACDVLSIEPVEVVEPRRERRRG